MKRYEIWMADLPSIPDTHVQYGYRPVIIVSNDAANQYSPVITIVPLTSQKKKPLPTHVTLQEKSLARSSTALCEQIMTLDKSRCRRCVGSVNDSFDRQSLRHALSVQLGMAG